MKNKNKKTLLKLLQYVILSMFLITCFILIFFPDYTSTVQFRIFFFIQFTFVFLYSYFTKKYSVQVNVSIFLKVIAFIMILLFLMRAF